MKHKYILFLFFCLSGFGLYGQNVGIGTPLPDYKLDVNGTVGINDTLFHNDDPDTWMAFPGQDLWEVTTGGRKLLLADGLGQNITINPDANGTSFLILADGVDHLINANPTNRTIGIGNSSPTYLLDVAGDFRIMGDAVDHLFYAESATGRIGFGTSAPAYNFDFRGDFHLEDQAGNTLIHADATSKRVGFGTNNPQYSLDVVGQLRTDEIVVSNNPLPFLANLKQGEILVTSNSVGGSPISVPLNFPGGGFGVGNIPKIILTVNNLSGSNNSVFVASVNNLTPDGCTIHVNSNREQSPDSWNDDLKITWVAWY